MKVVNKELKYQRLTKFKDQLYSYVSSINSADKPSKQLFAVVLQTYLETSAKNDSTSFCSTCFTKNLCHWKLKLSPRKRISKRLKRGNPYLKNQKFNELVLTCVVCRKAKKEVLNKPKS